MFTCWDSSERTWCGVCDANVAVGLGFLQVVPLFASWSTILPPEILMCALIFCIAMLCLVHIIWWTMTKISSLSGWLCWAEGWWM